MTHNNGTFANFFKVHLKTKDFFTQINLCICLKRIAHFCPFNPNLNFLQAVKVTKSGHHLLHDPVSKRCGSFPVLMLQTSLHACLQRLVTTMQIYLCRQTRNKPMPLTSSVVQQMMARFCNLYSLTPIKKSRFTCT